MVKLRKETCWDNVFHSDGAEWQKHLSPFDVQVLLETSRLLCALSDLCDLQCLFYSKYFALSDLCDQLYFVILNILLYQILCDLLYFMVLNILLYQNLCGLLYFVVLNILLYQICVTYCTL